VKTRREILGAAVMLPAVTGLAAAQEEGTAPQPGWLKEIAAQLQAELKLPAVWVAANTDGRVEAAVVGVRKFGDPTAAKVDDRLTIASISKPMAGLWIATLVDQGKLTYAAKVLDLLPELSSICLPEHRDLTLGPLLTHTGGVPRDARNIPGGLRLDQFPAERLRQAREVLSTPAPAGSKGKEVYSNNGVTLAVTMAERAAGEPYETAAGRLYRERLGLSSWGVWTMDLPEDLSLPWPHSMKDGVPAPQSPRSVQFQFVRPSGGAHCTIADLVRFGNIAGNAAPLSRGLLKPETWAAITAVVPNTGTVLSSFHANGVRTTLGHSGSLGTTSSNLIVIPEWRYSFAVHTNASADSSRGTDLIQDVLRKRRAQRQVPPACGIALTSVATVDESWRNEVVPKATDPKVRIRVNFRIEAADRTGDLQTLVKLGDVERRDDRLRGLAAGNHTLHFEFDTPKVRTAPVVVTVDSLRTAGNRVPRAAQYRTVLTLE